MDLDELAALRTPGGRELLDRTAAEVLDGADDLAVLTRLRRGTTPGLAAAALGQTRLRQRAARRLGEVAWDMFFTPDGAEQATRPDVADRRAARYVAAGAKRVLDAACGIGGDAIALARAGLTVHAVDLDPLVAAVCRANAEQLGLGERVRVEVADATALADSALAEWPAAFCDPARRRGGRRVFDPAAYSPAWEFLPRLARLVPLTAAKVAPGIDHALVPDGVEAEWVSVRGTGGRTVVEATLWWGELAGAPRRATLLPEGISVAGPGDDSGVSDVPPVGPVGRWLYEPDGAVIRAGLVGTVVAAVSGRLLDPRIAYVTADDGVATPFATRYEVTDVLPLSSRRLRALIRERDVGVVTVKKRGVDIDPDEFRRTLRPSTDGREHAVVVLTRIGQAPTAIVCRPPAP